MMTGSSNGGNQWSDLPKEILEMIGRRLDSRLDVYRYRSVCSSWRSSVPASYRQSPSQSIKLPEPINVAAFFSQVTICRIHSVDHQSISDQLSSISPSKETASATSTEASWLTKVEESTQGEMQLLRPLSNRQVKKSPGTLPKFANLLEFRLVELEKAYTLKLARGCSVFGVNKVVLHTFTSAASWVDVYNSGDFGLLVIYQEGKLGYWRCGDDKWTLIDEQSFHYDDIIAYKGQFYVVDRRGNISWIDSALNLVQYSPPLFGCGDKKNLVESCGDLYVVDRYLDGECRSGIDAHLLSAFNSYHWSRTNYPRCRAKTVDVKVYKLDEEWGTWVDVSSLGDRVFVLGSECCFSVSAKDFPGCEGNCVYFTDPIDVGPRGELSGYSTRVFKLSDRSIGKASSLVGESHLFWPPVM